MDRGARCTARSARTRHARPGPSWRVARSGDALHDRIRFVGHPDHMKQIHTDGACRGNPGPGGWAWAGGRDSFASGAAAHTTNQRMEVMAVIEALRENVESPLEIVSDSSYVVKCFNDK